MPEKPGFFDTAKRFFREITKETVFIYDPAFTTDTQINQDGLTATTHWKRNADGSIVIGKDQIEFAIKSAKAFEKTLGKKLAEETETVIGLSVAYIKEHFPQALKDAGYDE